VACALAVLFAGCGTSDYNALVRKQVARLRGEVKFRSLYGPTTLPGTPVSVRVPMIFSESYAPDSPHPVDGQRIRPDRVQPPFLPLPGLKLCYENTAANPEDVKLPFYCYLAAVPAQPGQADKYASDFQARLKKAFPDAPDAWEAVDAESPTGFAVHWRKIRTQGNQPFLVKQGNMLTTKVEPGIFELWLHDAGEYVVLVGWRAPVSINQPAPDDVKMEAGIILPPDNPKPDMDKYPQLTAGTLTIAKPEQ
jgi:hypothetical protein